VASRADEPEILCGMRVFRPSSEIDPQITVHEDRGKGIRTRRIEPDICSALRK
jgi:hypothetical protein